MQIISHRGYWKKVSEKNREIAFRRSFGNGFGTETDIRDYGEELVISHDIAVKKCMGFEKFLKFYTSYDKSLPLALNVKADGLQEKIKKLFTKYKINNYFLFDMSVPEAVVYAKHNLNIFSRLSEYEKEPLFYEKTKGIWIDGFTCDWVNEKIIKKYLNENKTVCIVSPELHKRDHRIFWEKLHNMKIINHKKLMLCTDYPGQAKEYFYGKN